MHLKVFMVLMCISMEYTNINDSTMTMIDTSGIDYTKTVSTDITFNTIVNFVIAREGTAYVRDYSINEESRMGITTHTYKRYYGHINSSSIKNLTKDQAVAIYKKFYWDANNLDKIAKLGYTKTVATLMDSEVNLGSSRANKMLQKIIGMPYNERNGIIDDNTLSYIKKSDINDDSLYIKLIFARKTYYTRLVHKRPVFSKYKTGWFNRLDSIVTFVKEV